MKKTLNCDSAKSMKKELIQIDITYTLGEKLTKKSVAVGIYPSFEQAVNVANMLVNALNRMYDKNREEPPQFHEEMKWKRLYSNFSYGDDILFYIKIIELDFKDPVETLSMVFKEVKVKE